MEEISGPCSLVESSPVEYRQAHRDIVSLAVCDDTSGLSGAATDAKSGRTGVDRQRSLFIRCEAGSVRLGNNQSGLWVMVEWDRAGWVDLISVSGFEGCQEMGEDE